MKLNACLILAAMMLSPAVVAEVPQANASLIGVWSVDTTRLPMAPNARPKSVTVSFAKVGNDRLSTRVEVVDPAGTKLEAEGVTPLDGAPTAVKSNFEADMSATTMPRPEVLIMQLAKNGSPASTRIYALAPDGNSMVETVAFFTQGGQPAFRKNYFSRVR